MLCTITSHHKPVLRVVHMHFQAQYRERIYLRPYCTWRAGSSRLYIGDRASATAFPPLAAEATSPGPTAASPTLGPTPACPCRDKAAQHLVCVGGPRPSAGSAEDVVHAGAGFPAGHVHDHATHVYVDLTWEGKMRGQRRGAVRVNDKTG